MKGHRKYTEIKWRMIALLVLCWLLPIVITSVAVSVVVRTRLNSQMRETVVSSTNKVIELIDTRLDNCRNESRNATYMGIIKEQFDEYRNTGDEEQLYTELSLYLAQQYRYSPDTLSVMVFSTDNPELFYSTYSSGTSYNDILKFKEDHISVALGISYSLDTATYLYNAGSELYLMRNLVGTSYKPYAMIVMQLDTDYLFDNLTSVWGYSGSGVFVDGSLIYGDDIRPESFEFPSPDEDSVSLVSRDGRYFACFTEVTDGRELGYVIEIDEGTVRSEQRLGDYILIILLLSMIPLIIIVINFFGRMVTGPVQGLVKAAEEIADENYGYTIETAAGSREFTYVNEAFNDMSRKLKQQFEQIYLEELAVRDANIKALQSQINPHFINNTLEIINWEARLHGVYKVSGMIEALSTMLNATLNRRNVQSIPLSEELEYVDAYLYIISERMGKRLTIEKDIDESLLREQVPRLIAQPIIENAVEHGVSTSGSGHIVIRMRAEDRFMYLEVRNSGVMSEEDRQKIEELLNSTADNVEERSVSIGIRNVNRRLKLMYGDECGLKIFTEGDETVSLLTFLREGGSHEKDSCADGTDS